MPRISVIMNCYNGAEFVGEAIQSVIGQSFTDWEIVFWDNASTDKTPEIAQSFNEPRLRYFRSAVNTRLGAARAKAIAEATGDWIAFVDHDDICLEHRFEKQMAAIDGGDYVMCYGGIREINRNGHTLSKTLPHYRSGDILPKLLHQFEANLQTTMLRRDILDTHNIRLQDSFRMFEDYNLFMRVAAKGQVCVVPEILAICRILKNSESEMTREDHAKERHLTVEQLIEENPDIELKYPAAFEEARARGEYFKAIHLMASKKHGEARAVLDGIAGKAMKYRCLRLLADWPAAWQWAHGREMKRRITALVRLLNGKL